MKHLIPSFALLASVLLTGCAGGGSTSRNPPVMFLNDMRFQSKFRTQSETPLFTDRRTTRPPVANTVAIGHLKEDEGYYTGVVNKQYIGRNPLKIDAELLHWGQRRFNTYCSPCHDQTGQGRGLVGQRAIWLPTNLLEERVRGFNDGEIFTIITNGRRSMPSYRFQIVERDRWAIIAYVRALQRATGAVVEDVPAELRSSLR